MSSSLRIRADVGRRQDRRGVEGNVASKFRLLCIVFRTVVARWRTRVGGPVRSDGL